MGDNSTLNHNKMNRIYIRKFCKATFISREYNKISVQDKIIWRDTIPDDQSEYSGASTQAWPNIYWDPTGNYLAWNGAFLSISKWCLPEHLLLSARLASQSNIKSSIYIYGFQLSEGPNIFIHNSNIFVWGMAIWNQCYLANNAK